MEKKNPAAVELGRLGGRKRAKTKGFGSLTEEQRRKVAMKGVRARARKRRQREA